MEEDFEDAVIGCFENKCDKGCRFNPCIARTEEDFQDYYESEKDNMRLGTE